MAAGRSALHITLAVVISLGITVGFVWFGPSVTAMSPDTLAGVGQQIPAPIANVTQTGAPPDDVAPFPQFQEVSDLVGFDYQPRVPAGLEEANSGVYVADFNSDGYEDILAVGEEYPVLFRNTRGAFVEHRTFEHENIQTAHFFDFDADGDRDLLLAQFAGELIYYENRQGTFHRTEIGIERRVSNPSSIVSADFTGDGCLDVFVTQYGLWSRTTPLTLADATRVHENHPDERPRTENGKPNLLFYGDCKQLSLASEQSGISGQAWSLVSSAADFTGDGYPDLHVGNDWTTDVFYINNQNGTFDRRFMGPETDRNAMSSVVHDMDGDLDQDLFVTNIYYPPNHTRTLRAPPINRDASVAEGNNYFVNDGTGNFTDQASKHGLQKGGWGWTATIADFNNDGHSDIVQTTQSVYWIEPYADLFNSLQVWKGTPETWRKVEGGRVGLGQPNTYSVAHLDYDNDGDLDVAVGTAPLGPNLRGEAQPFKLYENTIGTGESLQFFIEDPDGIETNAAVYIETNRRVIHRSVTSNGNFHSQDTRMIHVGLANEQLERVTIYWPDGTKSVYTSLNEGNRYILTPSEIELVQ